MSICIYVVLYFTILLFILNTFICVSDNNMGILCSLYILGNMLAQLLFVVSCLCCLAVTRRVSLVEQELLTLPEHPLF